MPDERDGRRRSGPARGRPDRARRGPRGAPQKPGARPPSPGRPAGESREGARIAKLLARAGVGSRREVERMIADGRIAVRGTVIDTPATILRNLRDVTVDGHPVPEVESSRLFLFHKPPAVLTTRHDPAGRPTIYDLLPDNLPRLMPVGRLDFNTEGLLLLTNDGELKRALELPASGIPRTYRVRALGQLTSRDIENLALGMEVDGIRYGPVDASLERHATARAANIWLRMTLTEGKNREVRNLCAALGLTVNRLIRIAYGPFSLEGLQPRQVVEAKPAQVKALRQSLPRPQGARKRSP